MAARKHEIECRGWISCATVKTAAENGIYVCWGRLDKVELELLLLDRKCKGEERIGVRKHEIECQGGISRASVKTAIENDICVCWGRLYKVELELLLLDRKCERGERVPRKAEPWGVIVVGVWVAGKAL